ncbi:hypothetical protein GWI33_009726 [Rhynchophorus ferrugineus]|uniref:Uncharacterized protein n=1 Tax=Rhynchophorus ferrugineus TaxID=354439 RepID=A0A834IBR5_RHYFE|nr:hypothetical protein GWI33_009726 [Rhynchophorus ferrugineus]
MRMRTAYLDERNLTLVPEEQEFIRGNSKRMLMILALQQPFLYFILQNSHRNNDSNDQIVLLSSTIGVNKSIVHVCFLILKKKTSNAVDRSICKEECKMKYLKNGGDDSCIYPGGRGV